MALPRSISRLADDQGRVDVRALSREGLVTLLAHLGDDQPEARALRVYKHLWQRRATSFDEMLTVSKDTRRRLAEGARISELAVATRLESADGTRKYLWRLHDGHTIESVLIPDADRPGPGPPRLTLCVSTQVGCAMACTFCLTGDLGLKRNLTPAEIALQPMLVQADLDAHPAAAPRITNIVMMGMGEPLHNFDHVVTALGVMLDEQALNFSHRRVTVSTVGLVPRMKKLAETLPVNIAVSLNASTEEQRRAVMPVTLKYSMEELMQACRELPLPAGKRITFEYVMMGGFNDSLEDAARVERLMQGVPAKVNLIPYNENPDRDIRRPSDATVKAFQHHLVRHGVHCSVRTTKGRDISAACGQLGKAAERMAARISPGATAPGPRPTAAS